MIDFSKMLARNFMRFAEIELQLDDNGPTLVLGQNLDGDGMSSNGSCKSGLFEVFPWVLYGETLRGLSGDEVVREGSEGGCMGGLEFTKDGQGYRIVRYQGDRKHKNGLELWVGGEQRKFKNKTDTQAEIVKLVGMGFKLFCKSVVVGQDSPPFTQLTDAEKKVVLEGVVGLDKFDEYEQRAKDEVGRLLSSISSGKAAICQAEQLISVEQGHRQEFLTLAQQAKAENSQKLICLEEKVAHLRHLQGQQEARHAEYLRMSQELTSLNPGQVSQSYERAKAVVIAANESLAVLRSSIEKAKADLEERRKALAETKAQADSFDTRKSGRITVAEQQVQQAEQRLSEANKLWEQLSQVEQELADLPTVDQKLRDVESKITGLENDLRVLQMTLDQVNGNLVTEQQKLLAVPAECPTCLRPFDADSLAASRGVYEKNIEQLQAQVDDLRDVKIGPLRKAISDAKARLAEMKNARDQKYDPLLSSKSGLSESLKAYAGADVSLVSAKQQLEQERQQENVHKQVAVEQQRVLEEKEKALFVMKADLAEQEESAEDQKKALAQREADAKYIAELSERVNLAAYVVGELKKTVEEVEGVKREIEQVKTWVNPYTSKVAEIEKKVAERGASMVSLRDSISDCEALLPYYEFWVRGFGKRGVRNMILDHVAAYLTDRATHYARMMTDGEIQVVFATQKERADGTMAEEFHVQALNRHGANIYRGNSMGERQRMDLCAMLALRDLIHSRTGSMINLLICDENLAYIDAAGAERVIEILRHEVGRGRKVFFVTQDQRVQDMFQSRKVVVKEGGVSRLLGQVTSSARDAG